jgi:hypothetical protein
MHVDISITLCSLYIRSTILIVVFPKADWIISDPSLEYEKPVSYYSDTLIYQREIRWFERDLDSHHLRVSRPMLYPLSYRVNVS